MAGVSAFAISGVLASRTQRPDIIGALILGFASAMSGGVIRDAILGSPARTFQDPTYFYVILSSVLFVFFLPDKLRQITKGLDIVDAIGLGLFNAGGLMIALQTNVSTEFAVVLGITSGCGGGIVRSILCAQMPALLKQGEIYITACIIGSSFGLLAIQVGASLEIASFIIAGITTTIRLLAIQFEWKLPTSKFHSVKK